MTSPCGSNRAARPLSPRQEQESALTHTHLGVLLEVFLANGALCRAVLPEPRLEVHLVPLGLGEQRRRPGDEAQVLRQRHLGALQWKSKRRGTGFSDRCGLARPGRGVRRAWTHGLRGGQRLGPASQAHGAGDVVLQRHLRVVGSREISCCWPRVCHLRVRSRGVNMGMASSPQPAASPVKSCCQCWTPPSLLHAPRRSLFSCPCCMHGNMHGRDRDCARERARSECAGAIDEKPTSSPPVCVARPCWWNPARPPF